MYGLIFFGFSKVEVWVWVFEGLDFVGFKGFGFCLFSELFGG